MKIFTKRNLHLLSYFLISLTLWIPKSLAQSALINASPSQVRASERFWKFSQQASLDFGKSGNAPAISSQFGTQNNATGEGYSTATDFDGNLLFFTSATQTYDRNGNATPNGAITGNNSATQGVIILPHLGNPDRYLTIYTSAQVGIGPNGNLLYSVFDINQNGGLGDLVLKNKSPHPTEAAIVANEMITYAPNATGDGFWIVSAINNSTCSNTAYICASSETRIYAIEVTFPGGNNIQFGTPIISSQGRLFHGYGSIEFNQDYSKAIMLSGYFSAGNNYLKRGVLTELDFDASTGVFQQKWTTVLPQIGGNVQYYTADYSPSEQYVFVSTVFGNIMYRFDISLGNVSTILASEISKSSTNSNSFSGALRTGPNGMIYIASYTNSVIWELTNPDDAAGNFTYNPKSFGSGGSSFGLSQTTLGVAVDYGDAPESYNTNSSNDGPRHRILYNSLGENMLVLGTTATSEANGQPSTPADNDSDDGIASFPALAGGTSQLIPTYSVNVTTTNSLTENAVLSGWIDWNTNGSFELSELASAIIAPGQSSANLIWTNQTLEGVNGTSATYARFRISTETNLLATGPSSDGEVEDYLVPFDSPLPVSLLNFDAELIEHQSRLNWSTIQETNSKHFEVEHSQNGLTWSYLGSIPSNEESSTIHRYEFTHSNPFKGENLYRLKMVDKDNSYAYSRIQSVKLDLANSSMTVYPNPASEFIQVGDVNQLAQFSLIDLKGNHPTFALPTLNEKGQLKVSDLDPGIYILKIQWKDGTQSTHKIVIAP